MLSPGYYLHEPTLKKQLLPKKTSVVLEILLQFHWMLVGLFTKKHGCSTHDPLCSHISNLESHKRIPVGKLIQMFTCTGLQTKLKMLMVYEF